MIEIARIVCAYPGSNAVDLVLCANGGFYSGVQVLCDMAGANHGRSGLMAPPEQAASVPRDAPLDPAKVIYGVVAMARGVPLLIGFLPPHVSQILFDDLNRFVWRHPSDTYLTATDNGDVELAHPSGTFLRIAVAPEHEDLTAKDHDKQWKIARNTDKAPYLKLAIANAGAAPHTTLVIDPSGNVTVENAGNWTQIIHGNLSQHVFGNTTAQLDGTLSATVNGTTTVHAKADATVTCDANLNLQVAGNVTSQAAVWNHTGNMNLTGTFTATTDVVGGGKSLKTHVHTGVTAGTSLSGPPQ